MLPVWTEAKLFVSPAKVDASQSMSGTLPAYQQGALDFPSDKRYARLLDKSLKTFFWSALKISLKEPAQAFSFFRTVRCQQQAARTRASYARQGVHVPPIMIFSITNRCNLHCKGCYHWALRPSYHEELRADKLRSTIAEAEALGISFIVLAGGEPMVRREILEITREFPRVLFLVFTNGLLIDDDVIARLKRQRNIIPAISLEGNGAETDDRRGAGVYARLERTAANLKSNNIFWSTSLTVTRENIATVTEEQFIKKLANLGCRLFFFVEYTPVSGGTEEWVITEAQRADMARTIASLRSKFPALFISVPGDEKEFGGCLAAGRGFVHISAEGNVEPCPFVPFSDVNIRESSLKDALQSSFLNFVRQSPQGLEEGAGGCTLWAKRQWLESLLHKGKALSGSPTSQKDYSGMAASVR
ncbi:MAG: radical SAM protein [Chloroflexi bacterium]|nr:radical SAM protein [Chloroflexota bacterium]